MLINLRRFSSFIPKNLNNLVFYFPALHGKFFFIRPNFFKKFIGQGLGSSYFTLPSRFIVP